MFGLFRTEKNPKGPDIKRLQHLNFDLVDSRLSLSLPYSNSTFVDRNHDVEQSFNIYDSGLYERDDIDDSYSYHTLLKRHYEYSRFNHRGYGNIRFGLEVSRINQIENLFEDTQLKNKITLVYTKQNDVFNAKASKNCQISLIHNFEFNRINNENFLCYAESQKLLNNSPQLYFVLPISLHHYVTFSFKHYSVRNTEEVWYQMAKAIEHQILSSVKLELNDELQAERDNANKG